MVRDDEWVGDDLSRDEVLEIDDCDAGVRLIVDEEELPIVVAVGFAQSRMVCITPVQVLAASTAFGEHSVGLVAISVPLPRLRRKHSDVLENSHAGDPDHDHLA